MSHHDKIPSAAWRQNSYYIKWEIGMLSFLSAMLYHLKILHAVVRKDLITFVFITGE